MAVQIEFQGFINEIKTFEWGTVYEISHNQVRKSHQGEWETVGRDYFSVIAPEDARELGKDMRVLVKGKFKSKRFDKKDGSKGISLEVRAESITVQSSGSRPEDKTGHAAVNAIWPTTEIPAEQVPF